MSLSDESPRGTLDRSLRLGAVLRDTLFHTIAVLRAHSSRASVRKQTRLWGAKMTRHVGVELTVTGTPLLGTPCLYVSNHVSYLDIPVLMSILDVTFIAKQEVRNWPLFGKGAATAGTVFMNRASARSRSGVAKIIGEAITQEGKSIGIFPEGTSSMKVETWKRGAFSVAKEFGFPVQPIRIVYDPLRPVAFIGDDDLRPHLWNLLGVERVRASVEFFEPVVITNADAQTRAIEAQVRASFERQLREWNQSGR